MDFVNELRQLSSTSNVDKNKLDRIFNEVLSPLLKNHATKFKKNEIDINKQSGYPKVYNLVEELFGGKYTIQSLIETEMKHYLIEKGFNVRVMSPNYFVTIAW